MKKKVDALRKNKNKNIPSDKVQKESFLNSVYLSAENNRSIITSLNNLYKNYVSNSNFNDPIIYDNLSNTGFQKLLKLKNKLKHSYHLLQNFNDKFIFNRIPNKVKKNKSEILIDLYKDEKKKDLLNISSISNKSRNSKIKEFKKDNNQSNKTNNFLTKRIIFSAQHRNFTKNKRLKNTNIYKELRNNLAPTNRRNISQDDIFLDKEAKKLNKENDSTFLYKKISIVNKNEDNATFKRHKNFRNYSTNQRHLIRSKSCHDRYHLLSSKNPYISYKSLGRPTSAYNKTNETTTINKNNNNVNYLSPKSTKSKIYNNNNLRQNFTNITNTINSRKKSRKIIYSSISLQNSTSTPFLFSQNYSKYFLSKKGTETKNQISAMASTTINKSKMINNILNRNYSAKERPQLKLKKRESINNKKFDWTKIRDELKLKDSNGLLAEIDEIELLENDLKKMEKKLSKKRFNFLLTVAKGIVRQDLLLKKPLVYNVGIENHKYRKKFFKLYERLNSKLDCKSKSVHRKKLLEKYKIK